MSEKHTPGPWDAVHDAVFAGNRCIAVCDTDTAIAAEDIANAELMAAAPDMLDALKALNKLISEAAMTGFNCHDGDWAERLFFSQQATSSAIRKAVAPASLQPVEA